MNRRNTHQKSSVEQDQSVRAMPDKALAVISENGSFDYGVDCAVIVEQIVKQLAPQMEQ